MAEVDWYEPWAATDEQLTFPQCLAAQVLDAVMG
ncbi:hypothetical protein ABIC28_004343 [Rhodococcus sp. PvR044]